MHRGKKIKNNLTKKKIEIFQKIILTWYTKKGRKFLWRKKGLSNYQYIIAEVLLQRTKAETVAKFYPKFLEEYPNWKILGNTQLKKLEAYIKPVGLYRQRSKRLLNLANEMVRRHGRLPKNRHELELIPSIGQYLANAIELLVFNLPSPLIDINMARVLERFFGPRQMVDIRYDPYLQELSHRVVSHPKAKEINWAILDLSALICKVKPQCFTCDLEAYCAKQI